MLLAAQMVCDVWGCTDMASSFSYTYPVFIYPFSSPLSTHVVDTINTTRPMASTAVDRVNASPRPLPDVVDGATLPYFHRSVVVTAIGYPTFSTAVDAALYCVMCGQFHI